MTLEQAMDTAMREESCRVPGGDWKPDFVLLRDREHARLVEASLKCQRLEALVFKLAKEVGL